MREIDQPHGADETHRSPDADGGKVPNDVEILSFEDNIGNGVVERNGGHEEEGVEQHRDIECPIVVKGGSPEEHNGADEVTEAEDAFGVEPAVGDDTEERGSEDGGDTHRSIDATHLHPIEMEDVEHIAAQRDEPGAPDEEFEEVHYSEPESYTHALFW